MRKTCLVLSLALILVSAQPSVAQEPATPTQPQQRIAVAVDPPSAEASMTRPQQIAHFRQIAERENATPPDREHAMKRLYHLYRGQGDQRRSEQWLARRNAFILEQERVILAGPALPAPPAVCTNLAVCGTGQILRDFDVYWRYTTLAEAAEQRRDYARVIAMREAAIPFMHGTAPLVSHWLALANDAREFAQYNDALRLCSVVSSNPIYEAERRQGERCSADVRFAMDDFTGWLAFYESTFTGPVSGDPGGSVRYCIAATRANRHDISAQACNWAAASVAERDAQQAQEADSVERRATSDTTNNASRRRMLALQQIHSERWRDDKAVFDRVIDRCRAASATADASQATECRGAPEGVEWRGRVRILGANDILRSLRQPQ